MDCILSVAVAEVASLENFHMDSMALVEQHCQISDELLVE